MKTDAELLDLLRAVGPFDDGKSEAFFELLRRKVNVNIVAAAAQDGIPTECEHGRDIWDTCLACEELEEANESLEDDA